MTAKVKWLAIYISVCFIPIFIIHFLTPLPSESAADKAVRNFLIFAPYVGLSLIAVLGWQINQTRIFWSALLLLGFYFYLLPPDHLSVSEKGRINILQVISVAYPLALCIIFLIKESRLWTDQSLVRFILATIPFLLFSVLYYWAHETYQKFFFWGPYAPSQGEAIPRLAWVTNTLFLLVVVYLPDLKIKPYISALMTTFIPILFLIQDNLSKHAVNQSPSVFHIIISFTAITIILLHCILRMYWHKVYLDVLTGIPNRQALDERLHTLTSNFALAMVDIDHFKKFNDTYGHAEGDNVLRMVAQHLQGHLGDRVYRYGGEEFCVIFDGKKHDHAVEMMDKARSTMEKRRFALRGHRRHRSEGFMLPFQKDENRGKKVHITVSVGVAFSGKERKNSEEVIKKADHWLYEAKSKGRNRVASGK